MSERLKFAIGASLLLLAGSVIGCSAIRRLPAAEEVVPYGENRDRETLRRGRALMVTECTSCHRTYWPGEFSPREWSDISLNMGQRASLTTPQTEDLRDYVMAAARAEAATR